MKKERRVCDPWPTAEELQNDPKVQIEIRKVQKCNRYPKDNAERIFKDNKARLSYAAGCFTEWLNQLQRTVQSLKHKDVSIKAELIDKYWRDNNISAVKLIDLVDDIVNKIEKEKENA